MIENKDVRDCLSNQIEASSMKLNTQKLNAVLDVGCAMVIFASNNEDINRLIFKTLDQQGHKTSIAMDKDRFERLAAHETKRPFDIMLESDFENNVPYSIQCRVITLSADYLVN